MNRRRALYAFLIFLAVFLLSTVVVLSSVTYYLAIDPQAYLTELQVPILDNTTRWNAAAHGKVERIQRIIHQTWKSETLPPRWRGISQECRDMMPDYEYMLWTDASSREFIAQHYPWFLDTFDNYTYPIQRADAIRYFVLHHYGGIYMDLDIGCIRPLDPLLVHPVILPKTIPVGVSNDLIFAEKGHPLMEQTIHNLAKFDYNWIINYPTVMFSTGPMFLSIQYAIYSASHPSTATGDVRVLPKSLYGKNAREFEAPHSFFTHFYGSSWHADDAAFIGFLASWGKSLMWVGLFILIVGLVTIPAKGRRGRGYDIVLPRLSRSGRLQFRRTTISSGTSTQLPSPTSSESSPTDIPLFTIPLINAPSTPELGYNDGYAGRTSSPIVETFHRIRNRITGGPRGGSATLQSGRSRGVLFFLPAFFAPAQSFELREPPRPRRSRSPISRPASSTDNEYLDEKAGLLRDLETGASSSSSSTHTDTTLVDSNAR